MNAVTSSYIAPVNPYIEIYEQLAVDAAFLWLLRSMAVNQPHYTAADVEELEQRIEDQLDGLLMAPEDSWEICREAMELQEPGEIFTGAVLAFRSLDVRKIQTAVEAGLASEAGFKGLVSALGWLPGRFCHDWLKRFLTSKEMDHKYLAVAACSVRREDPCNYLTAIFRREDCLAHPALYARSLRLVGELKRRDLMPAVQVAMASEEPDIAFWANWSGTLLGDPSALKGLRPFVLEPGPHQGKAIELAFRALPVEEGRSWINALGQNPEAIRNVIKATAALGDPQAVSWLIGQMRIPALSRLAGEAFTTITGIDLEEQNLALEDLPDLDDQLPNEDPEDTNVEMDEDEHLPFPDVAKIAAIWQKYQNRLAPGKRHLLGRPITAENLIVWLHHGLQRQRQVAAVELALLNTDQPLANTKSKVRAPR